MFRLIVKPQAAQLAGSDDKLQELRERLTRKKTVLGVVEDTRVRLLCRRVGGGMRYGLMGSREEVAGVLDALRAGRYDLLKSRVDTAAAASAMAGERAEDATAAPAPADEPDPVPAA